MKYALKRLVTGLGAGRETARPCYSVALAQVRRRLLEGAQRCRSEQRGQGRSWGGARLSSMRSRWSGRWWHPSRSWRPRRPAARREVQAVEGRASWFPAWAQGLAGLRGAFRGYCELRGGLLCIFRDQGFFSSRGNSAGYRPPLRHEGMWEGMWEAVTDPVPLEPPVGSSEQAVEVEWVGMSQGG